MVIQKKRLLFIFISCFFFISTWAVIDEEIDAFSEECLSEEGTQDEGCLKRFTELSDFVEENSETTIGSANAAACASSNAQGSLAIINGLAGEVDEVSSNLTCTEEDASFVKDQCGKQIACNMGRSVIRIVDSVAPRFISRKVESSLGTILSTEESSQCLNGEQPDCLSEVYRAFISSLLSTFTSLRDIGRAAVGAFSNMKEYLFSKSDDLHTAAATTQGEATKFFDSPGQYIISKLSSFKVGIDQWIKNQVFCQKWEGDVLDPERKCVEPLQGYSCLDCNDNINAFCAGAGFFISEGLLTVATAGTFTGLGLAARVSANAVKGASLRGASILSAKVPALARLTSRGTRVTSNTARTASAMARTMNNLKKAKDSVTRFGQFLAQSRVGRITVATKDVALTPIKVIDNMSTKAIQNVLVGASRIGGNNAASRLIRQTARQEFRAFQTAARGTNLDNSAANFATRSLIGRAW